MKQVFLLLPVTRGAGVTTTALGLRHLFDQRGLKSNFFWPAGKVKEAVTSITGVQSVYKADELKQRLADHKMPEVLEDLVAAFDEQTEGDDVVCVLGVADDGDLPQAKQFNMSLAKSLDARIILVAAATDQDTAKLERRLKMVVESLETVKSRIEGVILNKLGVPTDKMGRIRPDLSASLTTENINIENYINQLDICQKSLPILGCIPWNKTLNRPRACDLEKICELSYLHQGESDRRRISWFMVATRSVGNLAATIKSNTLLVTAGDRDDILLMAALAEMKGIQLAGLLLTGGVVPSDESLALIQPAIDNGLPIMLVNEHTYDVVSGFPEIFSEIPHDDEERFSSMMNHIAEHLNRDILRELVTVNRSRQLSPAAFRYGLVKRAKQVGKTIVLPEGDEPRTIQAAQVCAERNIAKSVLLGDEQKILEQAQSLDIELHENIQVINPENIYEKYMDELVSIRQHKGMNEELAKESLLDNTILLGTMMLQCGDVDGLVSGAVNTTAATVQPALQIIKTKPGQALVSSCFFMCLPDQVLVYADCAINPDPNAEQLADIAMQSAESAYIFGIDPKVAMISYSTGISGHGADVDKVRSATQMAQEKIANYPVDGPLQYDAASVASVAKSKAPNSDVAGRATVYIFPDLNTGNTTYKAVQRSAGVISVGPMLQGLNKPVNDLSRGALVDDIVYTIALTAIQAAGSDS